MKNFDNLRVPKYVQLMLKLKEEIEEGILKAGDPLPTREKLMREHGLSLSTVTRAISELERQGWLISRQGSGTFVARRSSEPSEESQEGSLIGLLLPYETTNAHTWVAEFVQEAHQNNLNLLVMYSGQDEEAELNQGRILLEKGVQGLIWLPIEPKRHVSVASLFSKHQVPVVVCESLGGSEPTPWTTVRNDHYNGMRMALNHLLNLGHTRIAYIGPRSSAADFGPIPQRWNAYKDVMKSMDLWDPDDLVFQPNVFCEWSLHRRRIEPLFRGSKSPTAIIGYTDPLVLEAMKQLSQLGIRFPEDVSLIGHGDFEAGAYSSPRLTTVAPSIPEFVDKVFRLLIDQMQQNEEFVVGNEYVIEKRLVMRESTHPLEAIAANQY